MSKLKDLIPDKKINEGNLSSKSVKNFDFSKDELQFLQSLINGVGSGQHPYADNKTIGAFNIKYVSDLMKKVKNKVPSKFKSQYDSVYSKLNETNEGLEDMDTTLPAQVNKFLDRAINVVKSYNLPKKKEQLIIAKIVDALGVDKGELSQTITKIKKYGIVQK